MASIRCVFGIRGHGKTTLARALAAPAQRMLAYDPFGEHDALGLEWPDWLEYLDAHADRERLRLALVGGGHEEEFCAAAWVVAGRGRELLVVCEEANLLAPAGRESESFRRLVALGRHRGISIIATSRRPAEVSRLLTSQADELYVCRMQEPADLRYLASLGLEASAAELPALPRFAFLHWSANGLRRGRVSASGTLAYS